MIAEDRYAATSGTTEKRNERQTLSLRRETALRMEEVAGEMGVNLDIVEDLREATLLVTSKKILSPETAKNQRRRIDESADLCTERRYAGANQAAFGSLFTSSSQNETGRAPGRIFQISPG